MRNEPSAASGVRLALEHVGPQARTLMERHTVGPGTPVREAMVALNRLSGETMTLFVVDAAGRPAGTVTDGDIRRALIGGAALESPVERVMHRDFLAIDGGKAPHARMADARARGIRLLPVIRDGYITDIIDLEHQRAMLPVDAVLMAGGRGERLRPLTIDRPKPLLEVGGKAIIDYNIDSLRANGIRNITVTVNYLKEQIQAHFDHPRYHGLVRCVEEPGPLGTIGSLSLVEGLESDHVLVMNSDLLTTLDFERLYMAHLESGAELTMAVVPYTVSIPFSIIRTEGERVTGLTEKPTYNYFAGAGVYLMDRNAVGRIARGERLDAPDLVERIIADGGEVGYFPVKGTWIDIGSPDDYRYANELMSRPRCGLM